MVAQHVSIINAIDMYTLKMIKVVSFMLYIILPQ